MRGKQLFLFNSMGRDVQPFGPVAHGKASIYSCGPTVYNYAHLGNLRAYVFTDTLRRILLFKGYDVTHVMNITDVGHLTSDADYGDDKMEKAAAREKKTVWDIAAYYTDAFHDDVRRLNILAPQHEPKATDYIGRMIAFAEKLAENGHTYEIGDGLYFDTTTVPDYGRLGLLDLEGQEAGARVDMVAGKKHPTDFCLWKKSPADSKRLMEWDSPWGKGAPGWHLECSVMGIDILGAPFDIHTGGIDHREVHHVNEIAQNQGYLGGGETGVHYWLHNDFLILSEDKMSKSKGGFLRLQTLLDQGIHPLVYRAFCLQSLYRKPLEFSWEALVAARAGYKRLLLRVAQLRTQATPDWLGTIPQDAGADGRNFASLDDALAAPLDQGARVWLERLDEAVSDDLNTPKVMGYLNELAVDKAIRPDHALRLIAIYDLVLGLRLLTLDAGELVIKPAETAISEEEIHTLIAERAAARGNKDFKKADTIRDGLLQKGVAIMDGPEGTTFEWLPRG